MESSSDSFYQAATLMLVGMAFVYVFLGLLIVVIKMLIAPLGTRFPDPVTPVNTSSPPPTENNDSVVAAISAAVTQYRKDRQ